MSGKKPAGLKTQEIVQLHNVSELMKRENIVRVPDRVQRYLDMQERRMKGKHFRIIIDQISSPKKGAGIAYSNALRIEKRNKSWSQVYTTGMMQYRGAYAHEIDNRDLSLQDSAILEESASEMVYAVRTGAGNVKVCRFSGEQTELLVAFNISDYAATQKRIELLRSVVSDAEAFRSYVEKSLSERWETSSAIGVWESGCKVFDVIGQKLENDDFSKVAEKGEIVVLLAKHYDRDYDAIVDAYQIFVWVKGKGVGFSKPYRTGLYHPDKRFYTIGISMDAVIANYKENSLELIAEVSNTGQQWKESVNFFVEWE